MNLCIGMERVAGCEWIRAVVPYRELKRRGHRVVFADGMDAEGRLEMIGTPLARHPITNTVHAVREADVLVLQRVTLRPVLDAARVLQARGRTKIVYEIDDNFHALPSHNPSAKDHGPTKEATLVHDAFIEMCDLLTVSTNDLRDELARYRPGKPIAVCPNALDDAQFARFKRTIDGAPRRPDQIRIGWAGSGTHVNDMRLAVPALCALMDEFPEIRIVFIGADLRGLFPSPYYRRGTLHERTNRVEFAGDTGHAPPFQVSDLTSESIGPIRYYDLIGKADIDVAIAPLESNTFNRCKSWIKALEYGMLGLPMVLTNFGPYRDFAKGESDIALLAESNKRSWYNLIRPLVKSAELRQMLGANARRHVERHHLISSGADAWEAALRSIQETAVA